jgi:hypothetical protein
MSGNKRVSNVKRNKQAKKEKKNKASEKKAALYHAKGEPQV